MQPRTDTPLPRTTNRSIQRTAIAYCRVSTDQQGESGAGLEWQQMRVREEAERRSWPLIEVYTDVASGKTTRKRGQLAAALADLAEGRANVLIVAKLDRLSRSMLDFSNLVERASAEGWSIVALDIGVDTSTTNGRMLANVIMALAQWERELIGDRTRDALQAVKARGVRLGRPVGVSTNAEGMIRALRESGLGLRMVANELNRLNVSTAQGASKWHASTVRAVIARLDRDNAK